MDQNIDDIGTCGVKAIEMGETLWRICGEVFSGKLNNYLKAMNDIVTFFTMIPKEFKYCSSLKDAFEKVSARYHMTLSLKAFF